MKEFAHCWVNEFDWRKQETRLNALPHFTANVKGLELHFMHGVGSGENPTPLLINHGCSGSIAQLRLGDYEFGIDVIDRVKNNFDETGPAIIITSDIAPSRLQLLRDAPYPILHKPCDPQELRDFFIHCLSTKPVTNSLPCAAMGIFDYVISSSDFNNFCNSHHGRSRG